MSYGAVTVTRDTLLGRTCYVVTFSGTSIAAATEVEITGLPTRGRIYKVMSNRISGDAATVQPLIGNATSPANNTIMFSGATAADPFTEQPAEPKPYYSSTGSLFYQDRPNAGSNNTTSVAIYILPGWAP